MKMIFDFFLANRFTKFKFCASFIGQFEPCDSRFQILKNYEIVVNKN